MGAISDAIAWVKGESSGDGEAGDDPVMEEVSHDETEETFVEETQEEVESGEEDSPSSSFEEKFERFIESQMKDDEKEEEEVIETPRFEDVEAPSFLSGEHKEALSDVFTEDQMEVLDSLMGRVYKTAREEARREMEEYVPETAERVSSQQATVNSWFGENPDIAGLNDFDKDYFGRVATKVEQDNPKMGWKEVLDQAAQITRERFGLTAEESTPKKEKPLKKGKFAKKGRGGRGTREKEVDDPSGQISQVQQALKFTETGKFVG